MAAPMPRLDPVTNAVRPCNPKIDCNPYVDALFMVPFQSLLIGHEFCSAQQCGWFGRTDTIAIVGNDGLNNRYARAANLLGLCVQQGTNDEAFVGALRISTEAGLI